MFIKESLLKGKNKEKESYMDQIRNWYMMVNGKIIKKMVKGYFIIKNVNIKECSYKENSMAQASYITANSTSTKANLYKTNAMAKAH